MSLSSAPGIELVPADRGEVLSRIQQYAAQSDCLRASAAFWTLSVADVGPEVIRCLSAPAGYVCVDIHYPTSIDHLAQARNAGVNVYIHLFDLAGQTEDPGITGIPHHLLHAKLLLFDLRDGRAVLWTGSHNWTQRALLGVNIEASLILTLDRGSDTYAAAVRFLEAAKSRCGLFDPALVTYYKWLQGIEGTEPVIELVDSGDTPIPNTVIALLGTLPDDYSQLKKVDQELLVSITSTASGRERFYRSTIVHTGKLDRATSAGRGLSLDARRHAFRRKTQLAMLQPAAPIPASETKNWYYFVTLQLHELLPENTSAVEPPALKKWIDVEDERTAALSQRRPRSGRKGDKPPRLRRAAPAEEFHKSAQTRRTLDERTRKGNRKLVTDMILNYAGGDEHPPKKRK